MIDILFVNKSEQKYSNSTYYATTKGFLKPKSYQPISLTNKTNSNA